MRVTLLGICLIFGGCFVGQKKPALVLPLPPSPNLTKPQPVLSIPAGVAPIETPPAEVAPPVIPGDPKPAATTPAPVTTRRVPIRRPRTVGTQVPEGIPEPASLPLSAPPVPEPAPQLREMLTPQKRAQYDAEFLKNVARARQTLTRASRRSLTPSQQENVSRIETFLKQAEASRKGDPGTARQLARRADLLGQDLLKSLLP